MKNTNTNTNINTEITFFGYEGEKYINHILSSGSFTKGETIKELKKILKYMEQQRDKVIFSYISSNFDNISVVTAQEIYNFVGDEQYSTSMIENRLNTLVKFTQKFRENSSKYYHNYYHNNDVKSAIIKMAIDNNIGLKKETKIVKKYFVECDETGQPLNYSEIKAENKKVNEYIIVKLDESR